MRLSTLSVALLASGLGAGCALVETTAPNLPADSETIVLERADAREVAATLNRLIESAYWKAAGEHCYLPSAPMAERWREITAPARPAGTVKEESAEFEPKRRPAPLLARDRRTLVVLDAYRTDWYLERIREYVAMLDVPTIDD